MRHLARGLVVAALAALIASPALTQELPPTAATKDAAQAGAATPPSPAITEPSQPASQEPAPRAEAATIDVFDLLRRLRHKDLTEQERSAVEDPARRTYAFAPFIGYRPSSGALIGVAGNVAFYRGDPQSTHISSGVGGLTVSTLKQTSATARFGLFTRDDRWKIDGDNQFQWTSQDTFGLGTATSDADRTNLKFDSFRVYETAYRALRRSVFAGVGFHYSAHTGVKPGNDAEADWSESPYVTYSETHGFSLASQTSAGASLNLLLDTRDSAINADRGWLASASYRQFFTGFLGGDSGWQEVYLDVRTYRALSSSGRHKVAVWLFGDLVAGGVAPYLDLPATGRDTFGRSGRGYAEGRFRGERLLYAEVEYRAALVGNGLVGMVAFLNTTTLANTLSGERLFDRFASAGGVGLRVLLDKRSRTNLCLDVGWGEQGSHGVYLAVQEAF